MTCRVRWPVRSLLGGVLVGGAALVAWWRSSPLPRVLLIRAVFARGGAKLHDTQAPRVPPGVSAHLDVRYGPDRDERLDVFHPAAVAADDRLPTIVWIHGGAFVAGDKAEIAPYLRILAAEGFTVVGVNYTLAPRARFPEPVHQVARAVAWLGDHATEVHADLDRVVVAGDSAGANLAAMVAALPGDPEVAQRLGVALPLARRSLRGALLYCGVYDLDLFDLDGPAGRFLRTVLWAYGGDRRATPDPSSPSPASVRAWVTPRFPPPFVSAGNADPLLAHSQALVASLRAMGVECDTLFFSEDHEPRLGHEYQFDASLDAFDLALARSLAYLRRVT